MGTFVKMVQLNSISQFHHLYNFIRYFKQFEYKNDKSVYRHLDPFELNHFKIVAINIIK